MSRSKRIAFAVSEELHDAISILAYSNRENISATLRKIITRELLDYGLFDARAANLEHLAETNPYFRPRAARQALQLAGEPA